MEQGQKVKDGLSHRSDPKTMRVVADLVDKLSDKDFDELINEEEITMPNDQNYLWSEDEETQDAKMFDFKKIKPVKYTDPKVKLLKYGKRGYKCFKRRKNRKSYR